MTSLKNQNRIFIAAGIWIVLWMAFFLLAPKSLLLSIGCFWAILAGLELAALLLMAARGNKARYITNAAFLLASRRYLVQNLLLTVVVLGLAFSKQFVLPAWIFFMVHLLLQAWFLWKILAMDAGQEAILETEEEINVQRSRWQLLLEEIEVILQRTPEASRKAVEEVRDAMRYSDPMENPASCVLDDRIQEELSVLDEALQAGDAEKARKCSSRILLAIRERNVRLKSLK